jgi:DNA-binding CsgD family transcriptional regulator
MSWLDDGAELALTPREQEILEFVAKGLSAKEIAGQIGIAPRTVEGHIDSVRLKVRARNKAHMVTQAVLAGVLKLGEPGRNGHPSAEELRLAADPTGKPPP